MILLAVVIALNPYCPGGMHHGGIGPKTLFAKGKGSPGTKNSIWSLGVATSDRGLHVTNNEWDDNGTVVLSSIYLSSMHQLLLWFGTISRIWYLVIHLRQWKCTATSTFRSQTTLLAVVYYLPWFPTSFDLGSRSLHKSCWRKWNGFWGTRFIAGSERGCHERFGRDTSCSRLAKDLLLSIFEKGRFSSTTLVCLWKECTRKLQVSGT